jgi:hypothetical protein
MARLVQNNVEEQDDDFFAPLTQKQGADLLEVDDDEFTPSKPIPKLDNIRLDDEDEDENEKKEREVEKSKNFLSSSSTTEYSYSSKNNNNEVEEEDYVIANKTFIPAIMERYGLQIDDDNYESMIRDEEGIFKVLDSIIETSATPRYASSLAQRMEQFVRNGGSEEEFIMSLQNATNTLQNYSDAEVYGMWLAQTQPGITPEEIETMIAVQDEQGLLERQAERIRQQYAAAEAERINEIERQRQTQLREFEERTKNFQTNFWNSLNAVKAINGLSVSKVDAENIYRYVFEPVNEEGESMIDIDMSDPTKVAFISMIGAKYNWDIEKLKKDLTKSATTNTKKEMFRSISNLGKYADKSSNRPTNLKSMEVDEVDMFFAPLKLSNKNDITL